MHVCLLWLLTGTSPIQLKFLRRIFGLEKSHVNELKTPRIGRRSVSFYQAVWTKLKFSQPNCKLLSLSYEENPTIGYRKILCESLFLGQVLPLVSEAQLKLIKTVWKRKYSFKKRLKGNTLMQWPLDDNTMFFVCFLFILKNFFENFLNKKYSKKNVYF